MTKSGVHIYDALSFKKSEGFDDEPAPEDTPKVGGEPVISLPAATNSEGFVSTNAEGYAWSPDGVLLATVDRGVAVVWDATKGYARVLELPFAGSSGGMRALRFSPGGSFLLTFEKHDREKCPENMQVWDMREAEPERVRLQTLKGYSSGAVTVELIQWALDESTCLEMIPGEGLLLLDDNLKAVQPKSLVAEPNLHSFQLAPRGQGGACHVAVYVPEATGRSAEVAVYSLKDLESPTMRVTLPRKLKSVSMHWNPEGSALLALASSDVDETGASYFGTTCLFWIRADGSATQRVCGPEEGLVQDVAWSPGETANEFLVIVGMLPATMLLYDGKTGKEKATYGKSRRNTIRWNPFGRLLVVGGFGALPGDIDFFDRTAEETVCTFRAALTVNCCWAPDGRHFLTCTTAPRMNEDNQASVYRYTGERLLRIDFKPDANSAAAGRKAADAGAMLFAAGWRPCAEGTHKDRPASPSRTGRRQKGFPTEGAGGLASMPSKVAAYRPAGARGPGGGGGMVGAMMRGEVDFVAPSSSLDGRGGGGGDRGGDRWGETTSGGMTHEELKEKLKEQRDAEKKAKLAEEEAARLAKEAERAFFNQIEDSEKRLRKLKKELAKLQELKEKEWDELTEEDEAQLEGELALREQIAQLEKGKSSSS